jgi:hypothetical protein
MTCHSERSEESAFGCGYAALCIYTPKTLNLLEKAGNSAKMSTVPRAGERLCQLVATPEFLVCEFIPASALCWG